jgi:putative acyl-CoA dehydrogenase
MRAAAVQALHHARHRAAFGAPLADQPLMRNVLADLALETEAATAMVMRLARGFDDAVEDPSAEAMVRLATAITKFQVCKRAPTVVAEAMECLGGGGYVEEGPMPRLYREAPVNGIWEGTGNVICLDILRTIARAPDALAAYVGELKAAAGGDRRLDTYVGALEKALKPGKSAAPDEGQARHYVERLALAWQAALLVQFAPHPVADAFCASRLAGTGGRTLGTLGAGADAKAIMARAWGG